MEFSNGRGDLMAGRLSLRLEVLRTYRQILKLARSWKAVNEEETIAERLYMQEEARTLFRKNKNVSCAKQLVNISFLYS